jgi:uncharacterized membrane protein YeaQ/YmgE (transglycosylase-associated protein family)
MVEPAPESDCFFSICFRWSDLVQHRRHRPPKTIRDLAKYGRRDRADSARGRAGRVIIGPPAPLSGLAKAWIAGALAFELTAGIVGGGLSGYFLDQWLHTQPFLTIILLLVGSVGGMVLLIRGLQRLER